MKRFFLIASLFCLVMSATVANDVGAANVQLQTCQLDMQHTSLLPAMFTPAIALTTPVVCIAQDRQFTVSGFLAISVRPESFSFIDPGSKNNSGVNYNRKYLVFTTNYQLQTADYLPTARHVLFV